MRPDRYVAEHIMTCGELRELLGYASAHVDTVKWQAPAADTLLRRVESHLFGLDARDGDQVFVFVADGP